MAESEWVEIRHPKAHGDNGPIATAKREAFNLEWKKKGWIVVKDAVGPVPVPGADEVATAQESPTPQVASAQADAKKEGN